MSNYYTLLTPTGLAKITNAQLTSSTIALTHVAVGDAGGTPYKPTGKESSLKGEKWRGGITSVDRDASNANWIVVDAVLPASVGGFTLREVALYDVDGDLIAIGNYPETYKPVISDGSTMDLVLRTIIEVNNTDSVTLKIDPNVIVASRKYVDDKVAKAFGDTSVIVSDLQSQVTTHLDNFELHTPYVSTTSGAAGVYNVDLGPSVTELYEGLSFAIKIHKTNTTYMKLNVNSLGDKWIQNQLGGIPEVGTLLESIIYTLRYNGTHFVLQGFIPLNNTLTSTSTVEAATANAVRLLNNMLVNKDGSVPIDKLSIGRRNGAVGQNSFTQGDMGEASGSYSQANGYYTSAKDFASTAIGRQNKDMTGSPTSWSTSNTALLIGNGQGDKSNAFRVMFNGNTYGFGAFNTTGADYAEFFEWLDANGSNEERVGLVVTLEGDKIRKALPTDNYILGIISATPSVVGDSYQDDWNNKYLMDEWGRIQHHYVDLPYETGEKDEEGNPITELRESYVPIINPNWDSTEEYVPREKRKEWDAVGLMGKLLVRDDGSCEVNGFAKVGNVAGELTNSNEPTNMRVIERINANIVRVFIK